MANEELIYRITRAIYGRLGANTDEKTVEDLVTDIYTAVDALPGRSSARMSASASDTRPAAPDEGESKRRLVVSVFGLDHPGIVAGVSQVLAEENCSIVDINQTVVRGKFAMVIIADMSQARESAAELKDRFRMAGERLGVHIYAQREDLFNAMHRV